MRNSLRVRTQAFITRNLRTWELLFALLTIVSVAIGLSSGDTEATAPLLGVEWAITGVFAVEYGVRVWAAPHRWQYAKSHPLDLAGLIPPIPGARLLRLVRLLRVASDLGSVLETGRWKRRTVLIGKIALVWVAVLIISALGLYTAEKGQNEHILDFGDAIWWAIVTMTTVGYGDVYPVTGEGRIAAGILMVLGIAFFSFLTATLTASIAAESPMTDETPTSRIKKIEAMRKKGVITASEAARQRAKIIESL